MSKFEQIEQLQRAGIGLVVGGLAFGGLSFGVDAVVSGTVLLAAGLIVWRSERRRELTVGVGAGIGIAGVSVLVELGTGGGFNELWLAGTLVATGVADFLLVPVYVRL